MDNIEVRALALQLANDGREGWHPNSVIEAADVFESYILNGAATHSTDAPVNEEAPMPAAEEEAPYDCLACEINRKVREMMGSEPEQEAEDDGLNGVPADIAEVLRARFPGQKFRVVG